MLPFARVSGDLVQSWSFLGEVTCKSNYQQVGQECRGIEETIIYNCLKQENNACETCQ